MVFRRAPARIERGPEGSSSIRHLWPVLVVPAIILGLFLVGELVARFVTYRVVRAQSQETTKPVTAGEILRHSFYNFAHRFPRPAEEARLLESGLPVYDLRISPRNLEGLRRTAERVMAVDLSTGIPREYVPATFLVDDDWVAVDVKLRGLTGAHYWRARPSLRVKFPKNRLFRGMRQINISTPLDKGLTKDVVTNWELSRRGLMTWQSRFIILRVNGDVVGMFQEIEQFGRSIIDREGRTEGFIFSGTGQLFGKEEGFGWDKASVAIERFRQCAHEAESAAGAGPCDWQFVSDYLEPELFVWAGAMSSLLGSSHAWDPDNLRLYFDPARGRLEPIPWDYSSYAIDPGASPEAEPASGGFGRALFRLPELRRKRDRASWTLVSERVEPMVAHSDRLFAEIADPLAHNKRRPGVEEKDRAEHDATTGLLRDNARFLKDRLERSELTAVVYRDEGSVVVDVENSAKAFVVVSGMIFEMDGREQLVELARPHIVDGVWFGEPGRARLDLDTTPPRGVVSPDGALVGLIAENGVTGGELQDSQVRIVAGSGPPSPLTVDGVVLDGATDLPPGFQLAGDVILVGPGVVELQSTLALERRYIVVLRPGTTLRLSQGVSLMVSGDLIALGTRERVIRVEGVTAGDDWGVIAVQGTRRAPSRVHLEWVSMTGGRGGESRRTHYTGAFAVTDGVVRLRHCIFDDAAADDGVNLRYCLVDIRNSSILSSRDDGLDLDFCSGLVIANRVADAGGDGLDVSGSRLVAANNVVERCGDKGVSVGERSFVELRDATIAHCRMGLAAKDDARIEVVDSSLSHLEIGVAAYQKKLTFGPPRVSVNAVVMSEVGASVYQAPRARLVMVSPIID